MSYIGRTPLVGNFVKLDTITTSATTTFNLTNGGVAYYPQSANNCLVSLNGILQAPTDSYTISGSTIVFSSALTTSDVIDFIIVLGDVLNIGTPSDGTVSFAKVTSNLITGATAETSIAGGDSVLIYDDSASALRKMTRTNFVAGVGGDNTPAFSVYASSGLASTTQGVPTKVPFNTEKFDTDSAYDSSTNYRFTVPSGKAGKYLIHLKLRVNDGTDTDGARAAIYKNGSEVSISYGRTEFYETYEVTALLDLIATDYIEAYFSVQDGTQGVSGGDGSGSQFFGFKII